MMIIMKNHISRVLSFAAMCSGILICTVSCEDDDLSKYGTDGRITFAVSDGDTPMSRAAAENKADITAVSGYETIPLLVNGDTIDFTFTEESNRGVTAEKPLTRGVPFDENSNKITQFNVTAIKETGDVYFGDEAVNINGGIGLTKYYWPAGNLSFCAYSCSKNVAGFNPDFEKTNDGLSGTFGYTLPATDGKNDAANQPDIVFAMNPNLVRTTSPVPLLFHHALSAIVFKVGKMPDGITLKSVAIGNVYSSGSCSMVPEKNGGIDNVSFGWTYSGTQTGTYTQELNQQAVQGERFGTEEHTFMMLPQEMGKETQLILTFAIEEETYTLRHAFSGIVSSWKPDTKYIFTIGLPDEVDVEVEDLVEGVVKKNVTIQNTGISTGYIRAAIVGYWVDNSGGSMQGSIVAPWDEREEGSFQYGAEWDSHWRKGEDGFYYHIQPVIHNDYTYPLFETYTLNAAATAAHKGQKLELSIVAQIVLESKLSEAWTIPAK